METILIGIGVVFGLLIALLAVPIDLSFNLDRNPQTHGHVAGKIDVRWLFGLLRFSVNIPGNSKPVKTKQLVKTALQTQSKQSREKSSPSRFFSLLNLSDFRQRLIKFARDLLSASHYQDLFLRLRIGIGDPADTGQLWILLGPLAAMARNLHSATVRIEPEFMNPAFEFQSHGSFRFIPIQFLALSIAFALSPPSLRAWRTLATH